MKKEISTKKYPSESYRASFSFYILMLCINLMAHSGLAFCNYPSKNKMLQESYLKSAAFIDDRFGNCTLDTTFLNENKKTINLYGDFGLGGYYASSPEGNKGAAGFVFFADANFLKNGNNWKLRFIRESEFNLFGPVPGEKFYDIGFLYGRVSKSKIVRLSISGGLGLIGGVKRGAFLERNPGIYGLFEFDSYKTEHILAPAIPIEIDLSLISRYIGIGLTGYANLNHEKSIAGFIIRLEFGKIR
ncbi:MAG: hypothetical protein WA816_13315 [Bacteroidales bacterium]